MPVWFLDLLGLIYHGTVGRTVMCKNIIIYMGS